MYIEEHSSVVVKQRILTDSRFDSGLFDIRIQSKEKLRPRNHLNQVIEKSELLHVNTVPPG